MMEPQTWNLFSASDLFMAFMAFVGFTSVLIVLNTAFRKVDNREQSFRGEGREL